MDGDTPELDMSSGAKRLEDVLLNLRLLARMTSELKEEISTEWERLKDGDSQANHKKLGSLVKGDVDALIKLLMQQEYSLNEFDKSRRAQTVGASFDLDAVRSEIGSRLDRLRRAADQDRISGQSE